MQIVEKDGNASGSSDEQTQDSNKSYTKQSLIEDKKKYVRRILDPKDNMDLQMIDT